MVVIKDMEMPSNCMNCQLLGKEKIYCSIYPRKDLDIFAIAISKPNWCPLVEEEKCKNGDMLLSMFDTATVYGIDKENDYITICLDNNFYQKFRYSWWNSQYKRGDEDDSN